MIKECYFVGAPAQFSSKLMVYPPTVHEVITNQDFWKCYKLFTLSQEEIEDELLKTDESLEKVYTPLEFLLINSYVSTEYAALVRKAFRIFCHCSVLLVYDDKKIMIGELTEEWQKEKSLEKLFFLNEDNFFNFQNEVRRSMGEQPVEPPNPNEDPRVKRIKAKARYRDKIKLKQGLGLKLTTCLAAICCMNMGLNPLNIGEISYASVQTLMRTYQEKEKYYTDIRSLQAGADAKKIKPIYWIRNLDSN